MPRLKGKGTRQTPKKCVKATAYPCGFTCISRKDTCRKILRNQAATFLEWLAIQEDRISAINAKRAAKGKTTFSLSDDKLRLTRNTKTAIAPLADLSKLRTDNTPGHSVAHSEDFRDAQRALKMPEQKWVLPKYEDLMNAAIKEAKKVTPSEIDFLVKQISTPDGLNAVEQALVKRPDAKGKAIFELVKALKLTEIWTPKESQFYDAYERIKKQRDWAKPDYQGGISSTKQNLEKYEAELSSLQKHYDQLTRTLSERRSLIDRSYDDLITKLKAVASKSANSPVKDSQAIAASPSISKVINEQIAHVKKGDILRGDDFRVQYRKDLDSYHVGMGMFEGTQEKLLKEPELKDFLATKDPSKMRITKHKFEPVTTDPNPDVLSDDELKSAKNIMEGIKNEYDLNVVKTNLDHANNQVKQWFPTKDHYEHDNIVYLAGLKHQKVFKKALELFQSKNTARSAKTNTSQAIAGAMSKEAIISKIKKEHPRYNDKDIEYMAKNAMMEQKYDSFKTANPDEVLLYARGDWLEAYKSDAIKVSNAINFVATTRAWGEGGSANRVPTVGFPSARSDKYLQKLTDAGISFSILGKDADGWPSSITKPVAEVQSKSKSSGNSSESQAIAKSTSPSTKPKSPKGSQKKDGQAIAGKTKFREFKKAINQKTILNNVRFYAYRDKNKLDEITNDELIKEWHYHQLASVAVRYWDMFPGGDGKSAVTRQFLTQAGGDDYKKALVKVLQDRGILDIADNSYNIDFDAIKKDMEQLRIKKKTVSKTPR